MAKKQEVSISKPTMGAAALDFATGSQQEALGTSFGIGEGLSTIKRAKRAKKPSDASGKVPLGDVRLTANITEQHHMKLKVAAATHRTTIGQLIELLVDKAL